MYSESNPSIPGNVNVPLNDNLGVVLNIVREMPRIAGTGIARLTVRDESDVTGAVPALLKEDLIYKKVSTGQRIARTPFNPYPKLKQSFVARVNSDREVNWRTELAALANRGVLIDSRP